MRSKILRENFRYYVAVAQRPNRLKNTRISIESLTQWRFFIMAESHLISQLTKLIESSYKEKAILEHQLEQLKQQKSDLEDKILCFENTLIYIEPNFDLRQIKTQFNVSRLIKPRLFKQNLQLLVARVLKQSDSWKTLYFITEAALELDTGKNYPLPQIEHELAVARVLKELYKKGIIERKEVELHKRTLKAKIFQAF